MSFSMKDNYFKNIIQSGIGKSYQKTKNSELQKKPPTLQIELEQPVQSRLSFPTMLFDNTLKFGELEKEFDKDQLSNDFRNSRKFSELIDSSIEENKKIELVHSLPDIMENNKYVNIPISNKPNTQVQNNEIKTSKNSELPTIEFFKPGQIKTNESKNKNSQDSVVPSFENNLTANEMHKNKPIEQKILTSQNEKVRIASKIVKDEFGANPESSIIPKRNLNLEKTIHSLNFNHSLFMNSLKSNQEQISNIVKDIKLISNRLDEHIKKNQPKLFKPKVIMKRQASSNLGGWGSLEREYIK